MKKIFTLLLIVVLIAFFLLSIAGCRKPDPTVPVTEGFDLSTLKGCVVHMVGRGNTPEIVFKKALDAANIEYVDDSEVPVEGKVSIVYYNDGAAIVELLQNKMIQFAILGEPVVSSALQKVGEDLSIIADMQTEWKIATNTNAGYPQTALVAQSALIASDPELVNAVAKLTVDNSVVLKTDATSIMPALREYDIKIPATLGADGVLRSNIDPTFGSKARTDLENYFNILKDFKPAMIGNKLPDDGFYYDSSAVQAYKENLTTVSRLTAGSKVTESITIAVPSGGPALGIGYLMKEYPTINGTSVTYKVVQGTAIKDAVLNGEADIAIMPSNMAATLYNAGKPIRLVGTNSYGLLYLLARKG